MLLAQMFCLWGVPRLLSILSHHLVTQCYLRLTDRVVWRQQERQSVEQPFLFFSMYRSQQRFKNFKKLLQNNEKSSKIEKNVSPSSDM